MAAHITSLSSHVPYRTELDIWSPLIPLTSPIPTIGQGALYTTPPEETSRAPLSPNRVFWHAKRHHPHAEQSSSSSSSSSLPLTKTLQQPLLIDKVATLEFLLAKARRGKISSYCYPHHHIPLKNGQINVISTIPKTSSNKLMYIDALESIVIPMSKKYEEVILITSKIATCIAATAVGFNNEGRPICRGLIHFDGTGNLFETFINRMETLGAVSIQLDQVNGITTSYTRQFFDEKVNQSKIPITLNNVLSKPYNLSITEITDIADFEFEVDLIKAKMIMGIRPDRTVFAIKECVWETVNIEKIRRLHHFVNHSMTELQALAKECRRSPQVAQEVVQDLINVLKKSQIKDLEKSSLHQRRDKDAFFTLVKSFLNLIPRPVF